MPRGRPNPARAVPRGGGFGTTARPQVGRSVGPTEVGLRPTGMQYTWLGQAVIRSFNDTLTRGFEQLAGVAQDYWENEEWTQDRHPYMTGNERNQGFFIVSNEGGNVRLDVGSEVPHAVYEEFGTSRRPGHYPLRNTLDKVAYRFSDVIRDAARAEGLA